MGIFSDVSFARLRQYAIIITANLSVLCSGMGGMWPSPVLAILKNETQTPLSEIITDEESSWIVSIHFLSSLATLFLTCITADRIGKKQYLVLEFLSRIVSVFIYLFAKTYVTLLIGRVFNGVADVLAVNAVGPYTAEIASKEIRGSLGTISQVFFSLGTLIIFGIGPNVTYFTLNLIFTSIVLISFVPILLLPESPLFLYSKGHSEDAFAVLKLLCDSESAALTELEEYGDGKGVKLDIKEAFRDKTIIKAMLMGIVIAAGTQLVGYSCVLLYLQSVLDSTHTNISSRTTSMIVGLLQLLGSIFSTLVIDRIGRRPILISSLIGMALGMFGLGIFFTISKSSEDSVDGFLNYVPLISMAVVVICFNAGAGSSSLILIVELMGSSYRMLGLNICLYVSTVTLFLTTRFFSDMLLAVGSAATFYIFCANCIIFSAFIAICVPETKNKSFGEIQRAIAASVFQVKYSTCVMKDETQ